jgi:hypothetical protein
MGDIKQYAESMTLDASGRPMPNVMIAGSTLQEQKTNTDAAAGVLTFSAVVSTIGIDNTDAVNPGVFIVNGINIKVPAGKSLKSPIGGTPSTQVTISGATTYTVSRYT